MSYLDKLLEGVEVEWKTLGEVTTITIGEFVHQKNQDEAAEYPVFNGGTGPTGYYEKYNNIGNKIIVSARGANAGFVNRMSKPYWAGNSCYSIGINDDADLNWFFVYYFLKKNENNLISCQQKGSIPSVSKGQIEKLLIPIPPLAVQKEIVRILDTFTELTAELIAELIAELTARKKQYNYYREQLLNFEPQINTDKHRLVEWKTLGEVLTIKNGKDYKRYKYGSIPVYGSGGIMTYIDTSVFNKPSVLIPRKGSLGNLFYVDVPFWTVDTIFWTDINTTIINPRFVYFYLQTQNLEELNMAGGVPSLTQTILNKIAIPVPSLEEQARIVSILDKFDVLTASISEGLPREIELRKKQYEYYRDLLLRFPNDKIKV